MTLFVSDDIVPIGDALGSCSQTEDFASTEIQIINGVPEL